MEISLVLRKTSLCLMFISFVLIIVGLIKESFFILKFYNSSFNRVDVGLFYSCSSGTCRLYAITDTTWRAFQAFLIMEIVIKSVAYGFMIKRPALEAKYASKKHVFTYTLIGLIVLTIICGTIAIGTGIGSSSRSPTSISLGVSSILMIISYTMSVISFLLYCIGWGVEIHKSNEGLRDTCLGSYNEGSSSQQLQHIPQQQIALNVNGQVVIATLTPANQTQPVQQTTFQPVYQPAYQPPVVQQAYQPPQQQITQPVVYLQLVQPQVSQQPIDLQSYPGQPINQPIVYHSYSQQSPSPLVMNGQVMTMPQSYTSVPSTNPSETPTGEFTSSM